MAFVIPDKTYFKIGEASGLVGVKPYIIRYWESEFKALKPAKTKSQQRLFRPRDLELLLVIRTLLYEHRFTIDGARLKLKELSDAGRTPREILDSLAGGVLPSGSAPAPVPEPPVVEDPDALRDEIRSLQQKNALLQRKLTDAAELLRVSRAETFSAQAAVASHAEALAGVERALIAADERALLAEAREADQRAQAAALAEREVVASERLTRAMDLVARCQASLETERRRTSNTLRAALARVKRPPLE